MKLLPTNDSTKVICVVATVCAPACDSHVKFYTTDWKELVASSYLPVLPVLDDFIAEAADTVDIYEYEDARRQADMLLMKADLSAKDATLAFTFTTTDYMGKEAAGKTKIVCPPSYCLYLESREVREILYFTLILSNPSP